MAVEINQQGREGHKEFATGIAACCVSDIEVAIQP
jgi:hypothetical protein